MSVMPVCKQLNIKKNFSRLVVSWAMIKKFQSAMFPKIVWENLLMVGLSLTSSPLTING